MRGFRLAAEGGEGGRVVDGEVGQDLAVQLDAGLFEAADELRVGDVVELRGRVDAHDPEGAVLALFPLSSAVGELEAALDGFLGCLVELRFGEEITAGSLEDFLAAVGAFCPTFDARHRSSPLVSVRRLEAGMASSLARFV